MRMVGQFARLRVNFLLNFPKAARA